MRIEFGLISSITPHNPLALVLGRYFPLIRTCLSRGFLLFNVSMRGQGRGGSFCSALACLLRISKHRRPSGHQRARVVDSWRDQSNPIKRVVFARKRKNYTVNVLQTLCLIRCETRESRVYVTRARSPLTDASYLRVLFARTTATG